MTWMKVDDGLHGHRKALRAGAEAMGLWLMAGSWVADQLTDGFVPDYVVRQFVDDASGVAARLVATGLWTEGEHDGDRGWWFHDWLDHNPSREKVLEDRRKDAEKKARMRAALAEKHRKARSTRPRGTPVGTPKPTHSGTPLLPDPGSLPSSGTPADGGRGAQRPPSRGAVHPVAEHSPASSEQARAEARAMLDRKVPRTRRHEGRRPLLLTVQDVPQRTRSPAEAQRDEQDRIAELDAVQTDPDPGPAGPFDADSRHDQRKQGTG